VLDNGAVSDGWWDQVQELFDPAGGSLPDLQIAGTTRDDWEAPFALVRSAGWRLLVA
jgi:hypothetical protein